MDTIELERLYVLMEHQNNGEGQFLLKEHGHFISAYEQMLKMSHAFNVLDARGAISVSERPGLIKRVRDLASGCAKFYLLHHFPPAVP